MAGESARTPDRGVDPRQVGQVEVHEHDVGRDLGRERDAAFPVVRFAHDLQVGSAGERSPHAVEEQGVVVDQQDPGHRASVGSSAWTTVPLAALVTLR